MTTETDVVALAIRHHQAGELALAEPIYRQLLAREPGSADAWHLLGVLTHQRGEHLQGLEYIGHAIRLNPKAGVYYNNLGVVQQALCDLEAAAKAFQTATELLPHYVEAHCNLANVCRDLGRFAEAETACRRVLELDPNRADVYYMLGNLGRVRGDMQAALSAYREAGKRQTAWLELLVNWGDTLREVGYRTEAVELLERTVAMHPDSPLALNNLGLALSDCGDFDRATSILERAANLCRIWPSPTTTWAIFIFGRLDTPRRSTLINMPSG